MMHHLLGLFCESYDIYYFSGLHGLSKELKKKIEILPECAVCAFIQEMLFNELFSNTMCVTYIFHG